MPQYSVLIGCDQAYYNDWGDALLKSIHHHNPWIKLRCHVVNPNKLNKLNYVNYTVEDRIFESEKSRIGYLQAVRFVVAASIPLDEQFITLDCDTICTRSFTEEEFAALFTEQHIMKQHKKDRWLACLIAFGSNNFRYQYAERLTKDPVNKWKHGRDQEELSRIQHKYNFVPVGEKWITSGKNKKNSAFVTLKGAQKTSNKYLNEYNKYKV
jgi:hypothetical protein